MEFGNVTNYDVTHLEISTLYDRKAKTFGVFVMTKGFASSDRGRRVLASLTAGRESTIRQSDLEDAVFDAAAVFLLRQEWAEDGASQAAAAHGEFDRDLVRRRFALGGGDGRKWKKASVRAGDFPSLGRREVERFCAGEKILQIELKKFLNCFKVVCWFNGLIVERLLMHRSGGLGEAAHDRRHGGC